MKRKMVFTAMLLIMAFLINPISWIMTKDTCTTVYAASINKKSITLNKGESKTLKIQNGSGTWKWSSSNKKVAKVTQKGKVTALKEGTCKIYAKKGKKTLACSVTVNLPHKFVIESSSIEVVHDDYTVICVYGKYTNNTSKSALPADWVDVKAYVNGVSQPPIVFTGETYKDYIQCDTSVEKKTSADVVWMFQVDNADVEYNIEVNYY